MVCVLCQFDPPMDPVSLTEYTRWFTGEGLKDILETEQLQELRVYRNFADISPKVMAMLFFPDVRTAIHAADSAMWGS